MNFLQTEVKSSAIWDGLGAESLVRHSKRRRLRWFEHLVWITLKYQGRCFRATKGAPGQTLDRLEGLYPSADLGMLQYLLKLIRLLHLWFISDLLNFKIIYYKITYSILVCNLFFFNWASRKKVDDTDDNFKVNLRNVIADRTDSKARSGTKREDSYLANMSHCPFKINELHKLEEGLIKATPFCLNLEAYIQVCRGLMIAAVCLGFFGAILALIGMKCTKIGGSETIKARLTVLSGFHFILSGESSNIYTYIYIYVNTFIPVCWVLEYKYIYFSPQASAAWLHAPYMHTGSQLTSLTPSL